jgi:hypothetical protein
MQATDVGAAAIEAIHRFEAANSRRPDKLYCGPEEMMLIRQSLEEGGNGFYGLPVLPMDTPGVVAG